MTYIIFLDTNVILDYLEDRNKDVSEVINQLLHLHKDGSLLLATSIFNIAELIESEFEIHFFGWCIKEKMSYDETIRKRRGNLRYYEMVSEKNRNKIEKKIRQFIEDNEIALLHLSINDVEEFEEIYELTLNSYLSSQDAMITATAIANDVTYFLSNDRELVNKISQNGLLYAFNLHDPRQRETFLDNVLKGFESDYKLSI